MSGKENWIAERIDRSREAPAAKAVRTQRAMFLRMQARLTITGMLKEIEDPAEKGLILGDVLDIIGEQLHPLIGRVEAATSFNSRAADICATFRLGRAIKSAEADQAWSRLQKPANDDGSGDLG
jgi:hypothetical protein